jgi:hypothetical protein
MRFHERSVARSAQAIAFAAAASIVSVSAWAPVATAADPGPFTALAGVWTGGGTISLQNGTKERLRCRVQYVVTNEGTNLQQALNCSSDTYRFQVNAYVNEKGGSLSGNWTEVTRNVSGGISGRAEPGKILISVAAGNAFSARMNLVTSGSSQSVDIRPKGSDITDVSVKLSKAR